MMTNTIYSFILSNYYRYVLILHWITNYKKTLSQVIKIQTKD